MRIKICGITRSQDAQAVVDIGGWAIGFIFYPQSKRYIDVERAINIAKIIPPTVLKVGVFVDQSDIVINIASNAGLDMLQLHGSEKPQECLSLSMRAMLPVIKAFSPNCLDDLGRIAAFKGCIDYVLIDGFAGGKLGGTGVLADWKLAALVKEMGFKLILAGGLNPGNIKAANDEVAPFALDLSSGVELSPGIKSIAKLEQLRAICLL